jgi:hypothetical protein
MINLVHNAGVGLQRQPTLARMAHDVRSVQNLEAQKKTRLKKIEEDVGFSHKYMAKENGKRRHPLRFNFRLHSMVKIAICEDERVLIYRRIFVTLCGKRQISQFSQTNSPEAEKECQRIGGH